MARRKSKVYSVVVLSLLAFALYGVWTFWKRSETQRVADKVEKSVKAVKKVW